MPQSHRVPPTLNPSASSKRGGSDDESGSKWLHDESGSNASKTNRLRANEMKMNQTFKREVVLKTVEVEVEMKAIKEAELKLKMK